MVVLILTEIGIILMPFKFKQQNKKNRHLGQHNKANPTNWPNFNTESTNNWPTPWPSMYWPT